jgi:hypothetical protein
MGRSRVNPLIEPNGMGIPTHRPSRDYSMRRPVKATQYPNMIRAFAEMPGPNLG